MPTSSDSGDLVTVDIAGIHVSDACRRSVDPAKVLSLAHSIALLGLIQPIILSCDHHLLAGAHRLAACRHLGHTAVQCRVVPFAHESLEAALLTIDENLMRNALTALEQGEHLLRRDEILAQLGHRKSGHGNGSNQHQSKGEESSPLLRTTASIAAEIGLSERVAQQRKQVARALTPEQRDRIRETPLSDRKTDLLAIARIRDPERRTRVVELMIGQDPPSSVKAAVRQVRIQNGEIASTFDIIKPSNWWAFGRPKYRQEDGFPGSIPGEVYANALYYFAPRTGVAADGMAGSGTLRRVYDDRERWQKDSAFDLDIYLFDKYPREPFAGRYTIRQHDMMTPLPLRVDWLFVDPPYFAICRHLYQGELARTTDYARYRLLMSKVVRAAYQSLNPEGVFCLYISPYLDINGSPVSFIDVPSDVVELVPRRPSRSNAAPDGGRLPDGPAGPRDPLSAQPGGRRGPALLQVQHREGWDWPEAMPGRGGLVPRRGR